MNKLKQWLNRNKNKLGLYAIIIFMGIKFLIEISVLIFLWLLDLEKYGFNLITAFPLFVAILVVLTLIYG